MLLVKVPFINGLGKTKGCEKAPDLTTRRTLKVEIDNENIEESIKKIYKEALKILKKERKNKVLFLGGDHSISYPLTKAFSRNFRKKRCLIVFDAHADCMPRMKEPTHEEWLRAVIEEKLFEKIFLIGARKIEPEERKFLKNKKEVEIVKGAKIVKFVLLDNYDIYLSLDIDVFDPDIAPGTGYKEKNGITKREFFNLINNIKHRIRAMDLVEVNPEKDINHKTIKLAREIINKIKEEK